MGNLGHRVPETFGDVLVLVNEQYALDLHLDIDEANAAGLDNDSVASFDGVQ